VAENGRQEREKTKKQRIMNLKGDEAMKSLLWTATGGLVNPWRATLLLLILSSILFGIVAAQAQDDVYFVNSGQLLRWESSQRRGGFLPQPVPSPAGMRYIASIAINRPGMAFVNTGVDGAIYRNDGRFTTHVYLHDGQVRNLAFGSSDDNLFFSVVPTPSSPPYALSDGQICVLNLRTKRVDLRYTIAQSTVDSGWWGAFTVTPDDRIFLGTSTGGIYELRNGTPLLVYHNPGDQVQCLASELNEILFTTGGSEVYRLRNNQNRQLVFELPGGKLTHVSFAPPGGWRPR